MKQLVVLSGKGGTGKTIVASSLIRLAKNKAVADCDVDAPNLHLVFQPKLLASKPFYGYKIAVLNKDACTDCGKCYELCRFGAIKDGRVDPFACEGCGVCEAFCPAEDEQSRPAIRLVENRTGEVSVGRIGRELFSTAALEVGSGATGKLVSEVKKNSLDRLTAEELFIIDGSPGIGCPVIASIKGAHWVLVVAEPSESGLHDLVRIVQTAQGLGARCMVCVNKYDINPQLTERILAYSEQEGVLSVGKIPFDPQVSQAINSGKTIVDYPDSPAGQAVLALWKEIEKAMGGD